MYIYCVFFLIWPQMVSIYKALYITKLSEVRRLGLSRNEWRMSVLTVELKHWPLVHIVYTCTMYSLFSKNMATNDVCMLALCITNLIFKQITPMIMHWANNIILDLKIIVILIIICQSKTGHIVDNGAVRQAFFNVFLSTQLLLQFLTDLDEIWHKASWWWVDVHDENNFLLVNF
jgi:hypothetical protein